MVNKQNKKYDIVGIGNAIVDLIAEVDDSYLNENNISKGAMSLVDFNVIDKICKEVNVVGTISGGSVANSIVCIAQNKLNTAFIGKVKDDAMGKKFAEGLAKENVHFKISQSPTDNYTGRCLILVSPDAERTMNTYLGISQELTEQDIDIKIIEESSMLYLEGYLWDLDNAKKSFDKAINIKPNYTNAYWNLHGLSSNINDALIVLNKIILIDKNFIKARIIKSVLEAYNGKFDEFHKLISSTFANHPFMRSVKWFLELKKLPQIFFNRWSFFDGMIDKSVKTRPFYEFGVWHGITFKYFVKTFKKGFGFDTFSGLPEAWHHEEKGRYNSFGSVPKIDGGEFIVGKFADTLPNFFFHQKRIGFYN